MENNIITSNAYHESGHTAAFCVYGFKIGYVTITPDPDDPRRAGLTQPLYHPDLENRTDSSCLMRQLVIKMSGMTVTGRLDELAGIDLTDTAYTANATAVAGKDREEIEEILGDLQRMGHDRQKCDFDAREQCIGLTLANWDAIKELARNLLIEKTMEGEQVNTVLKPFGLSAV